MNEQNQQITQLPPPNYLVWAILSTIFCCQITGIISIIYAATVNSKWAAGDSEGAMKASKNARTWVWVSVAVWLAVVVVWIALAVLGVVAGFWANGLEWMDM